MKIKLFTLFIALVVSAGTLFAWDFEHVKFGNLYFNLDVANQTANVTSQNSNSPYWSKTITTADIPASVTYDGISYSVTGIGYSAFDGCSSLTSVTIPNSVTSIGNFAFEGCSSLTSVTIPNSVTGMGQRAFFGCSSLTTVTLPDGLTGIGSSAFEGCSSLTSVTIPNRARINRRAFYGCSSLTTVTLPNNNYSIGESAFQGCYRLTSVTIPSLVLSIGEHAFEACSGLTSVTIVNSITSIGNYAFKACSSLTSVTIPNRVTSIGQGVFLGCSGLNSVAIPNSVTSIGNSAFSGCSGLTSVTIPNSVTSIGEYAFSRCSGLTSVAIPSSVTSIGNYAFRDCTGLTSIEIPNSVTSIGDWTFYGCTGLTSVTIPNSVTSIGNSAFYYCTGLTSVTIPNSVTNIGNRAFSGCGRLNIVTMESLNPPTLENDAFSYCSALHSIYVPCGSLNAYKKATNWSTYASYIKYHTYEITTNTQNGNVTIMPDEYSVCSDVTLTAIPNEGYYFTRWSDGNTDNPRVIVLTQDTIFTAEFSKQYSVNVSCNELYGTIVGKNGFFEPLSEQTYEAIPNYGYHFTHWSDGVTDNPRTVILTQDTSFSAEFEPNQYSINVSGDDIYGHIEGENGVYDYNTEHTFEAIANYGYHFAQWSDGNTDNPRTIVLNGEITLSAIFAKNSYTIADNSNHEQGYIDGIGSYEYLDERTITAIGQYGYHFDHWSDGNKDNPRTIIIIQDTTFTAEFAIDKSGTCGENNALTWTYDNQSKTLTITGNGALTDNYTFGLEAPTEMNTLIIGDGVTAIGDSAFYGMTTINHLFIGANVASIGNYAFAECRNFDDITCYATIVPAINATTFENVGNKQYIYLYVPEDRERAYHRDKFWGEFDIRIKGTEETTTDTKSVTVDPSDNTALFTWPTDSAAASYSLQITKDGEVFCTLTFNANGQLTGIAFAPSRNGAAHAQAAAMSVSAMSFTVTGLTSASKYAYRLSVTDESQNELQAYSGEFATIGYEGEITPGGEPEINPEGLEDVLSAEKVTKILHNGQILILRGDHIYTLTGQEVK